MSDDINGLDNTGVDALDEPTAIKQSIRPKLIGARFEGGVIPLDVLGDLAALEEMVVEVAKWRFLQEHTNRTRLPKGFADSISLKLIGLEEGSAIPVIMLSEVAGELEGMPPPYLDYFRDAMGAIVDAIDMAERNQWNPGLFPQKCLSYFKKFGKSLRDEESVEFIKDGREHPVRLTQETRRVLVRQSDVKEFTEQVALRGTIPEADQDKGTFRLRLANGSTVNTPLEEEYFDTVIRAFSQYRDRTRVLVKGLGKYRQENLSGWQSVHQIDLLDPLDTTARLEEFQSLGDGWFDGEGLAPSHDGLDWLAESFESYYPAAVPKPHLYPTYEGRVRAEWSLGSNVFILEVELDSRRGEWLWFDRDSDAESSRELELYNSSDWNWLVEQIQSKADVLVEE